MSLRHESAAIIDILLV